MDRNLASGRVALAHPFCLRRPSFLPSPPRLAPLVYTLAHDGVHMHRSPASERVVLAHAFFICRPSLPLSVSNTAPPRLRLSTFRFKTKSIWIEVPRAGAFPPCRRFPALQIDFPRARARCSFCRPRAPPQCSHLSWSPPSHMDRLPVRVRALLVAVISLPGLPSSPSSCPLSWRSYLPVNYPCGLCKSSPAHSFQYPSLTLAMFSRCR
ncbi:hypothetical protein PLICRDRAFT_601988 [Plicaturopsis crispa FD-325 SS-3]|nr:hypothetical protein PLICRDRAFT_601988 [Plicaturopsis crispa FD-325 SS-3]